ncbi:MAG: T9SS type A sorting domain-containing protein [Bacteroidia bacterium]
MKKFTLLFASTAVLLLGGIQAEAQSSYIRTYWQTGNTASTITPSAMTQCSNGDVLISWNDGNGFAVVSRLDATGYAAWSISLGDVNTLTTHSIQTIGENTDGSIWVFGMHRNQNYQLQYFITEITSTGTINWTKFYWATDELVYESPSCSKMYDDGYMINLSVSSQMQVLRTDADGNLMWGKAFKTDSNEYKHPGFAGTPTYDGGFVMTSKENSKTAFVKVNLAGGVDWGFSFEAWQGAYCHTKTTCQLTDGSIIAGGYIDGFAYLMKIDIAGSISWIKTFTSSDVNMGAFYFLHPLSDGTFITTGGNSFYGISATDFMLRMDADGNILGSVKYNHGMPPAYPVSTSMLGNANELYLLSGDAASQNYPISLIKVGNSFESGCNISPITVSSWSVTVPQMSSILRPVWTMNDGIEVTGSTLSAYPIGNDVTFSCVATGIVEDQTSDFSVFPNPSTTGDQIRFTTAASGRWTLTDATGRVVMEGKAIEGTNTLPELTLSSGIYIFRLVDENGVETAKQKLIRE